MSKPKLETFRCHIIVRGEQCPCDLTLVNTFTFVLSTLIAKNPGGVTLQMLRQYAICPWHARFLAHHRKDIVPMAEVIDKAQKLIKEARFDEKFRAYWKEREARSQAISERIQRANTPRLGLALRDAGITRRP